MVTSALILRSDQVDELREILALAEQARSRYFESFKVRPVVPHRSQDDPYTPLDESVRLLRALIADAERYPK